MDGVEKPIFHNGKRALDFLLDEDGQPVMRDGKPVAVPAVVREYSDRLLMFFLTGQRALRFRSRNR
jgi:hypothetical protein